MEGFEFRFVGNDSSPEEVDTFFGALMGVDASAVDEVAKQNLAELHSSAQPVTDPQDTEEFWLDIGRPEEGGANG